MNSLRTYINGIDFGNRRGYGKIFGTSGLRLFIAATTCYKWNYKWV